MAFRSKHSEWWVSHPPPASSLRAKNWVPERFIRGAALGDLTWRHFNKPGCQFVYFIEYGRIVKVGISRYPWFRFSVILGEIRKYAGFAHLAEAAGPGAQATIEWVAFGGMPLETAIQRYLMRDLVSGEWYRRGRRVRRVMQHLMAQRLLFAIDEVYPLTPAEG